MTNKYFHYRITGMMIAETEKDVEKRIWKIFTGASENNDMSTINIEVNLFAPTTPDIKIQDHDSSK